MQGLIILIMGLLAALGCSGFGDGVGTGASTTGTQEAVVSIATTTYNVDLAVTTEERQQGLSGREHLPQDAGMLFVFEEERPLHFWMKEMHFPLDIIWIDAQCRLLDVSANVPTPPANASNEEIPRAQSPAPARYVLEVNAGEAERNGLQPGDPVQFLGAIADQHGC